MLGELTSLALAKNWVALRAVAATSCVALDPIASLLGAAEGAVPLDAIWMLAETPVRSLGAGVSF